MEKTIDPRAGGCVEQRTIKPPIHDTCDNAVAIPAAEKRFSRKSATGQDDACVMQKRSGWK